MKKCYKP